MPTCWQVERKASIAGSACSAISCLGVKWRNGPNDGGSSMTPVKLPSASSQYVAPTGQVVLSVEIWAVVNASWLA